MNPIIEQMLNLQPMETTSDRKNGMKEVIQEIVLSGLSRAGFFSTAAFYGGTALRIFYGLDRFSEDLDFSLREPDPAFDLSLYLPALEKEIRSYGLNFNAVIKEKTADSDIRSPFLKGNTKEHMLMFYGDPQLTRSIGGNELIKIKFEVDTNPPDYATFETKYRLLPIPYEVSLYDMPSLFAGKVHAFLCRSWKSRVKGRDLYDYIFYLAKGTAINLPHLNARLSQSGHLPPGKDYTITEIKRLLCDHFQNIDYAQAKEDVTPFIRDRRGLDVWNADFFCQITNERFQ